MSILPWTSKNTNDFYNEIRNSIYPRYRAKLFIVYALIELSLRPFKILVHIAFKQRVLKYIKVQLIAILKFLSEFRLKLVDIYCFSGLLSLKVIVWEHVLIQLFLLFIFIVFIIIFFCLFTYLLFLFTLLKFPECHWLKKTFIEAFKFLLIYIVFIKISLMIKLVSFLLRKHSFLLANEEWI